MEDRYSEKNRDRAAGPTGTPAKKNYIVVPEGTYDAVAIDFALKESNKGDPVYVIKFRLNGDDNGVGKGKEIEKSFFLANTKGMEFLGKALRTLGVTNDDIVNPNYDKDKVVSLVIEDNEYVDKDGNTVLNSQVKWINDKNNKRATGGQMKDLSRNQATALSKMMKNVFKSIDEEPKPTNNAPSQSKNTTASDDDIPF